MKLPKVYGIICVVIDKQGKILLLKRSPDKKYQPGRWASVAAGPISPNEDYDKFAASEVKAETGLGGRMLGSREEVVFDDEWEGKLTEFHIKPYLFEVNSHKVTLNKEHTEYVWLAEEDLPKYNLIPAGEEIIKKLLT